MNNSILFADLSTLIGRRKCAAPRRRLQSPAWFGPVAPAEDEPQGAGWFESSADLKRGLAVIEGPLLATQGVWVTILSTAAPSSITASA